MGQNIFLWLLGIIVLAGLLKFVISSLNRPSRKLLNLTRKLSDNEVTNEKAEQLIGLLMSIKTMPKRTAYWDSIKTAYRLVEQSGNVNLELKQKLRTLLQGLSTDQFQGSKKIS
jgi:HAMP domain-containing protein